MGFNIFAMLAGLVTKAATVLHPFGVAAQTVGPYAQGGFTYAGLSKNAEAIKDFKPLVTDFKLDFAAFVLAFANLASVLENMILLAENILLLAIVYLHVWIIYRIGLARGWW